MGRSHGSGRKGKRSASIVREPAALREAARSAGGDIRAKHPDIGREECEERTQEAMVKTYLAKREWRPGENPDAEGVRLANRGLCRRIGRYVGVNSVRSKAGRTLAHGVESDANATKVDADGQPVPERRRGRQVPGDEAVNVSAGGTPLEAAQRRERRELATEMIRLAKAAAAEYFQLRRMEVEGQYRRPSGRRQQALNKVDKAERLFRTLLEWAQRGTPWSFAALGREVFGPKVANPTDAVADHLAGLFQFIRRRLDGHPFFEYCQHLLPRGGSND